LPPLADKTLAPDACALRDTDMLPPPSPPALSSFTSVTAPSFFTSAAVDRHHYTFKDAYVGAGVLFFCVSPHKKTGIRAGPAASRCFVFAVWRDEGPDSTESLSPARWPYPDSQVPISRVFLLDKTSRVKNQGSGEEFRSYLELLPYLQQHFPLPSRSDALQQETHRLQPPTHTLHAGAGDDTECRSTRSRARTTPCPPPLYPMPDLEWMSGGLRLNLRETGEGGWGGGGIDAKIPSQQVLDYDTSLLRRRLLPPLSSSFLPLLPLLFPLFLPLFLSLFLLHPLFPRSLEPPHPPSTGTCQHPAIPLPSGRTL